jgi:hypothetical protein
MHEPQLIHVELERNSMEWSTAEQSVGHEGWKHLGSIFSDMMMEEHDTARISRTLTPTART